MNDIKECNVCKKKHTEAADDFIDIKFTGGEHSAFGQDNEVELNICSHCLLEHMGNYMRVVNV